MAAIERKGVLHKFHKYKKPPKVMARSKTFKLDKSAWKSPNMDDPDGLAFSSVQGPQQVAAWYSPGAVSIPVATADVKLTTWAYQKQDLSVFLLLFTYVGGVWI